MDWRKHLEDRLADPANLRPYRRAIVAEGCPLPPGRQVYAIGDVLGVEPGDLILGLRTQHADDEQAMVAALGQMEDMLASRDAAAGPAT